MALPIPSMSMMAKEIAGGYVTLSQMMLKGVPPDQLRALNRELIKALQAVRGETVDLEDFKELKARNMKLSRLNHALQIVKYYCKSRKIHI